MKCRVFVVEDHPLMRRSFIETIQRESDLTVCGEAGDVPEALAAIASLGPDLVLTDLRLKSSTGLDLIKTLQRISPALPVVATTLFDVRQAEREARAAGAAAFLAKQEGPERLITLIRSIFHPPIQEPGSAGS
ncbi:MAG: response regulator transcription factor [Verrucomicrobia bacterium]|nr:response regulator transcription factor [Verrucomicrobiota bacterium]